ncbi:hypothetical protein Agub_g4685 [Astrephomene gubernaculifera]|uniref:DUF5745 domain-containing protein n=1 Tax=Astrephomene gubernaculifera TaxID=47775 RepID=A0AAD3DL43_9CHLO|nr:hypothetical protein Agub_g4685 [Astrephomene gubernaculifera]
MAEDGFSAQELIQACNKVIAYAGLVARVASIDEVKVVCSSTGVFVAALEGLLQVRLEDVLRAPSTNAERAYNCNLVVDALSQILDSDLSHISGQRVVEGSIDDISNLLELLAALCQGKPLLGPPAPGHGEISEDADDPDEEEEEEEDEEPPSTQDPHLEDQALGQSGTLKHWIQPGQQLQQQEEEEHPQQEEGLLAAADATSSAGAHAAAAANGTGRRRNAPQRPAAAAAAEGGWLPPSPFRGIPQEGLHSVASGERPPGYNMPAEAAGPSGYGGRPANSRVPPTAPTRGPRHNSGGGASSLISIPSDVGGAARHGSDPGIADQGFMQHGRYPQQYPHVHGVAHLSWSAEHQAPDVGEEDAVPGRSETSLLERAMSHADATLRGGMGQGYDYYHDAADAEEQGRRARGGSRCSKRKLNRRNPCAVARPAGPAAAAARQRPASARPSKRGLVGAAGVARSFREASPAVAPSTRREPSSRQPATKGGVSRAAAAAGTTTMKGSGKRREGGVGDKGGAGLRALQEPVGPPRHVAGEGHRATQRVAAAYRAAMSVAAPLEALRSLNLADGSSGSGDEGEPSTSPRQPSGKTAPGMHLSADLEGKLRYVYRLASSDPKQQAARNAVQKLAVVEEQMRHVRRREMLERLGNARARREAALRHTADRLHEQGQEHERRVEQLRLQRLASEWASKQRSAQMRRALAAELALREAFLEVLEGEKELRLAERREAKEAGGLPQYKGAMRHAEQQYMQLYNMLEELLASERQQRVRASREAEQAQRHSNQLAATVVRDRMRELLGRIAREEEAALQRNSVATRPESKQALKAQMRRLLGMS